MLDNIDKLEVSEIDEMIETLTAEKAKRQEEEQHLNEMREREILHVDVLPHGRNRTPYDNISIRTEVKKQIAILHDGIKERQKEHQKENRLRKFSRKHTIADTIELLICQGLGKDYFTFENLEPDAITYLGRNPDLSYFLKDGFIEDFTRIRLLTDKQLDAMQKKKKRLQKTED